MSAEAAAEALHAAIDGDFLVGAGMSIGNTGEDVAVNKARVKEVVWWAVNTLAAAGLLADPTATDAECPACGADSRFCCLYDPAATDAVAARARREALDEVERIAAETWPGPLAPDLDVVAQHYLDRLRETCRAVRDTAEPATEVRDGQ